MIIKLKYKSLENIQLIKDEKIRMKYNENLGDMEHDKMEQCILQSIRKNKKGRKKNILKKTITKKISHI